MLPMFSPDGKWIAYMSDESGSMEVYIRPFPGPGGKWQVSAGGRYGPVCTKSGRELLYLSGPSAKTRIMAVEISATGDTLQHSVPRLLFETSVSRLSNTTQFDVSPDGTRLAILKEDENAPPPSKTHVTLIFNFFTEVRRVLRGVSS